MFSLRSNYTADRFALSWGLFLQIWFITSKQKRWIRFAHEFFIRAKLDLNAKCISSQSSTCSVSAVSDLNYVCNQRKNGSKANFISSLVDTRSVSCCYYLDLFNNEIVDYELSDTFDNFLVMKPAKRPKKDGCHNGKFKKRCNALQGA